MKRLSVLLAFGGESSEHDVSVSSARNVYQAMNKDTYDIVLAYIDNQGKWWLQSGWTDTPEKNVQLASLPGTRTLVTFPDHDEIHIDVLFPVLHGKNGEDGSIQGLAQMAHIPQVGCGVLASALCMDKMRTKLLLEHHSRVGIKTADWIAFTNPQNIEQEIASLIEMTEQGYSDFTERLGEGPWFVKPSRAGSSVGVSKVEDTAELLPAVRSAFEHDTTVLVERAIVGRELEVAVLGNPPNHTASKVGEIIPGESFYSYEDKYSPNSKSQAKLSVDLPESLQDIIRQRALKAYEILACEGLARLDFFVTSDYEIYLNEVNTMPGFTNISMYPKLWQNQGMSYEALVDKLIQLAIE